MIDDDVNAALLGLRHTRRTLSLFGQAVFVVTSIHLMLVLAATSRLLLYTPFFATVASLTLIVITAALALMFEYSRKRGDALFEEISDEFQWHVSSAYIGSKQAGPTEMRPPLMIRVELRSFAQSSDLPLAPGRYGPLAYVAVNVSLVIILILRFTMLGH